MRSFVKEPAAASAAPEPQTGTGTAVAETPIPATHAVAIPQHGRYVEGDIQREDIKTPYLSCVQAVGPKSVIFSPGQVVLGEVPISSAPAPQQPTPKFRVLFCRVSKTFVENLPYNPQPGGPRAKVFGTAAEVAANGGVTEWRGNIAPTYLPKLTCLALIRCPAALDDGQFNLIADDKAYAPAMVSFQKTSYSAAKTLLTDLSMSLSGNPTNTFYDLLWVREQRGQNWVWVAKLIRARDEAPSAALKALADKLTGGNVKFDETEEVA